MAVNWYPLSKRMTAYVDGTERGIKGCDAKAVLNMVLNPPAITGVKAKRKPQGKARRRLMRTQNGMCYWCGRLMLFEAKHCQADGFATIDHVVPLARGGLNNANNKVLACKKCNAGRSSDMPEVLEAATKEEIT